MEVWEDTLPLSLLIFLGLLLEPDVEGAHVVPCLLVVGSMSIVAVGELQQEEGKRLGT